MSTRSLTVINDNDGKEIAVLYRHMDGYPTGHGVDLATFLDGFKICNGASGEPKSANGMGCLAAQIVSHFKMESMNSGYYLYAAGTRDIWEEYIYIVRPVGDLNREVGTLEIELLGLGSSGETVDKVLFTGSPADLLAKAESL